MRTDRSELLPHRRVFRPERGSWAGVVSIQPHEGRLSQLRENLRKLFTAVAFMEMHVWRIPEPRLRFEEKLVLQLYGMQLREEAFERVDRVAVERSCFHEDLEAVPF